MNEPALLQLGNAVLSTAAAAFVCGATQKLVSRRLRFWLGASLLFSSMMYFAQFTFALDDTARGLTPPQVCVSMTFNLTSSFCLGMGVLSHYIPNGLRELTSSIVLAPIMVVSAVVDLATHGWYASSIVGFLLYAVLAWVLRHSDITVAMVFLAYACLQVPKKLGPVGNLEFDFALLVASKFALIGAIYKSFDALHARVNARPGSPTEHHA